MRAVRLGVVGLGALLAGCVAIGCSSNGATSDDAGPSLDAFFGPEDDAGADTSTPVFHTDAGDATVPGTDATLPEGDDAGDSAAPSDTGTGGDTNDAKSAESDAGDASHEGDAGDAAVADGGAADSGAADGGVSDSSVADSASTPDSASEDAASEDAASEDAASEDAASEDAATDDAASEDTGSDAGGFDASAACAALSGDPIQGVLAGVVLSDGGVNIVNYQYGASSSGSGQAPTGATITFEAWTAPQGVMSSISVMYWLNADSGGIQSIPLVPGPGPAGEDSWTGTLPAQTSGTTVTWWVQATDVCHGGTDYYSNGGANYVYSTQ